MMIKQDQKEKRTPTVIVHSNTPDIFYAFDPHHPSISCYFFKNTYLNSTNKNRIMSTNDRHDHGDVGTIGLRLSPYWMIFVIRGILLIIFGVYFVLYPASGWSLFSLTYGIFCLVEAVFNFSKGILVGCCMNNVENKCSLMMMFLLSAICSAGVGTIAIISPIAMAEAMEFFLAIWMISVGICQLWFAWIVGTSSGFESDSRCFMSLIGITFLVTGFSFLGGNLSTFILFLGTCLTMFGVQLVFFGFQLRKYGGGYSEIPSATAASTTIDV
jgi:uncharacterized membrane protein HdeD (DUF308 family)